MNKLVLGDSLEVLIDHRGKTPKKLGGDFTQAGVPVASAILVADGVLDLSSARCVSDDMYRKWMPVPTKLGDVLLTSEAPLGRVARVPNDAPLVLGQRLFGLRGKSGVLDNGYLYYALQTVQVKAELTGHATGTTVVGIRQSALRTVKIPAPPFVEQQAIAEVLGALDDKIAANRTLIAGVADLIEAKFCAVEKHPGEATFADAADVGGGGTPKTKVEEYWGGDVQWATPTDVTGLSGAWLRETNRKITEPGLTACASSLYPEGSILMTSRATIGAFAIAARPMAVNQGFIVVNSKTPASQWWLYAQMRARTNEFLSHANGATFLELSRGRFKALPVWEAHPEDVRKFCSDVDVLMAHSRAVESENEKLAATRDGLLPLLMSGKLRVKDAEKRVGEVV